MSEIDPSLLDGDKIPQGRFTTVAELDHRHENTDLDVKGVLLNTFILVAVFAATFWFVKLGMDYFISLEAQKEEAKSSIRFADAPPPPEPVLQSDPGHETATIFAVSQERLNSYGWVDRDAKMAHIPIERAIAILAEKGLPKRGKMDAFHPRQGSSNPVMIGVPDAEPKPVSTSSDGDEATEPQP